MYPRMFKDKIFVKKMRHRPDNIVKICWLDEKSGTRFLSFKIECLWLRWGWVFLERAQILNGIQFTTHFIEFFVVETKQFVGSFVNLILTRQTYIHVHEQLVCGVKMRRRSDYLIEFWWVVCPIHIVWQLIFTNHCSKSSFFNLLICSLIYWLNY